MTRNDPQSFVERYAFSVINEINEAVKPWMVDVKQIQHFVVDITTYDWKFTCMWKWPNSRIQNQEEPEELDWLDWGSDWRNVKSIGMGRQTFQIADAHIITVRVPAVTVLMDKDRIPMTTVEYINNEIAKIKDETVQAIASKAFP